MVNVDLYSAIITNVCNALNTLVSGEKPGFQALSKGLIVLLCTEVVRQGVQDQEFQYMPSNAVKLSNPTAQACNYCKRQDILMHSATKPTFPGPRGRRCQFQANGLPQGSVLAPTLFNLNTNDLPVTRSRRLINADDICSVLQVETLRDRVHS